LKKVFLPKTLDELWSCLDGEPNALPYAGGTDLLVRYDARGDGLSALVCLERIADLRGISADGGTVRIGAATTLARILDDEAVLKDLPVLAQAIRVLGSPIVRNMGTIGGNIGRASPAGDTLPPLYALGAALELISRSGSRRMAIGDFIAGPGRTRLERGEVIAAVRIAKPTPTAVQHYEKVGHRNALACSLVSMAAVIGVGGDGVVESASLAWGSVGPTVVKCPAAEMALIGGKLDMETLRAAAGAARDAVTPIGDVRADANYRRTVAGNLLLRLAAPA
jgi:CO/xanthine dehydrogenase FAD-binding subunit